MFRLASVGWYEKVSFLQFAWRQWWFRTVHLAAYLEAVPSEGFQLVPPTMPWPHRGLSMDFTWLHLCCSVEEKPWESLDLQGSSMGEHILSMHWHCVPVQHHRKIKTHNSVGIPLCKLHSHPLQIKGLDPPGSYPACSSGSV